MINYHVAPWSARTAHVELNGAQIGQIVLGLMMLDRSTVQYELDYPSLTDDFLTLATAMAAPAAWADAQRALSEEIFASVASGREGVDG